MELSEITGSIGKGKLADFFVTDPLPDLAFFYYAYTMPMIREVWLKGEKI